MHVIFCPTNLVLFLFLDSQNDMTKDKDAEHHQGLDNCRQANIPGAAIEVIKERFKRLRTTYLAIKEVYNRNHISVHEKSGIARQW